MYGEMVLDYFNLNRPGMINFLANYDNKEGKRKHYISLILVFNVVKTSVYSENGKWTGHCRYIKYQNKFVHDFSFPQKKHALRLRRQKWRHVLKTNSVNILCGQEYFIFLELIRYASAANQIATYR